jgi:CHAT domain-containing protein
MTDFVQDRRSLHGLNIGLVLLIVGLTAVATRVLLWNSPDALQAKLIRGLSELRVGGTRFFQAPPIAFDEHRYRKTLVNAELFVLSEADPAVADRIRALAAAGTGRLRQAADILQKRSESDPENAEILNDLGVVLWGLGDTNPSNYFKALMLFERATQLAPAAAAPRYNAVLAFRRTEIRDLEAEALQEYRHLERTTFWNREISNAVHADLQPMDRLRETLASGSAVGATALLERYPGAYRRLAIEYALNPPVAGEFDNNVAFVLNHFGNKDGDETAKAILAPLRTHSREQVLEARRLVHRGITAYLQSRLSESLQMYDSAEAAMGNTDSVFDRLWIKLKRGDSQLRSARGDAIGRRLDVDAAARLFDEVIDKSRTLRFKWLLGHALVSKSVASVQLLKQDEVLLLLKEAIDTLSAAGASQEAARPLYYAATIHSLAGDSETSLSLAYRSLSLTQPDDHVRLSQLYWLAGLQTYRMGFERYAMSLERQAVSEAVAARNYGIVASHLSTLATIHAARGDYAIAEEYLAATKAERDRLESSGEQALLDLALNLVCGRIRIGTGSLKEAEDCLNRNLVILHQQPKPVPEFFSQTLLQLAEVHSSLGRFDLARQHLRRATEVIEQNDADFAAEALRMPFENQRRSLYDTAIGFEYDHQGDNTAWIYTQKYRSKLFLEFLRQMNPGVSLSLSQTIERDKIQQLIPDDVQVVEYVMLKNRLLIWFLTKDRFASAEVPVTRVDLEQKIARFIDAINNKRDIRSLSEELYRSLIQPIESHLDPKRTLAIIPDQALHRLAFPALYSAVVKSYLIQRYTILESPNLTTLLSGRSAVPLRSSAVLFGARADSVGATKELRALEHIYRGAREFNGETASKVAFLSSLQSASVFHYAGHSQDAADPLRSSILLDGEREGPNSVNAIDISRRRIPANSVVVLASCDSSVGNSRDGVGMRGLTSAFLIGGAGSVVGSLWLVDAESTSQLVLEFHKSFAREGLPVAAALRNAQMAFIKDGVHPYYWSGFVVTGNSTALR